MDEEINGFTEDLTAEITTQQESVAEVSPDFGGRLLYGLKISAVGLSVVFIVLIILMAIIKLFELFMYTIPNKRKQPEVKKKIEPEKNIIDNSEDDAEIAAVIAAAVDAYYANDPAQAKKHYRVKSFKRI